MSDEENECKTPVHAANAVPILRSALFMEITMHAALDKKQADHLSEKCALITLSMKKRDGYYGLQGLGASIYDVHGGSPKSSRKGQNQLICDSDKGGGDQQFRKFCGRHIWKPP